jgi:hypothetical protein
MIRWSCAVSTVIIIAGAHLCFPHEPAGRMLGFVLIAMVALFFEGHTGKR